MINYDQVAYGSISVASSGDNTILAAQTGYKIVVHSYTLVAAGAVTARWYSGAGGTARSGAMTMATGTPNVSAFNPLGHLETAVSTALVLNLGGAVQVSGHFTYSLIPA